MLLDGHHRREAYRRARVTTAVPVEWFKGDLDAAIVEAGARNCQEKLPMSNADRMNFAWRLVKLGTLSKAAMRKAAGSVRAATVGRVLTALRPEARLRTTGRGCRPDKRSRESRGGRG